MSTSALPEDLSQHLSTITLPLPTDLAALFQKRSVLEQDLASFDDSNITTVGKQGGVVEKISISKDTSAISISSTAQDQNNSNSTQTSTAPLAPAVSSQTLPNENISYKAIVKAKATLPEDREGLTEKLKLLNELIIKREAEMRESDTPLLKKGLSMNEKGEMLNEEGLPFVGINFEEDEPYVPRRPPSPKPSLPSTSTPTGSTNEAPKVRVGGLIQRNGKQTLLKSKVLVPSSPTPSTSSLPPSKSEAMNKKFEFTPESEAILARFEREEQEEAEAEELRAKLEATTLESTPVVSVPSPVVNLKSYAIIPPKKALSGFSSGFLNKKPKSTTPIASVSTPPVPAASTSSTSKILIPASDDTEPRHEPLHHILPPSKSIYRPTPPSSRPNTRPSSPRPSDKKVVFDLPAGAEESIPKSKKGKEVIILGGPEPLEDDSPPVIAKNEPAQRPLREVVVERPIKPPSEPRMRPATRFTKEDGDGLPLRTLGIAPKSTASAFRSPFAEPTSSSTSTTSTSTSTTLNPTSTSIATPIHTLSLSSTSNSLPSGHLSIANYEPEDQESDSDEHSASELRPSLTSDGSESSDSSGFYGSDFDEDEEEEDEIDIDGALHNREVALEYHRLRMNVGAGAGTGPLGGDRDPESYDSWNQENVPTSATQQGRTPGSDSSRFRTGRLESAQMIIPSLLQEHIRTNIDQESDEEGGDDGLTPEERENLRNTLAELAGRSSTGGRSDMDGRRTEPQVAPSRPPIISAATNSISQMMEEAVPARPAPSDRIGQRMATPIALPSNAPLSKMREEKVEMPQERVESIAPVKKMSRFKARQLGLEPEVQN